MDSPTSSSSGRMTPAIPLQTPGAETASNQFLPSFSNLDLQGYLHLHPHPAYILPSPRLSSSSSPSLSPLYSNPAALDLSPNLEPIIIEGDRKRLKRLIASHDQELDDALFGSSDQDPIDTDSLASYNSFEGRGGNGSGSMDDVLEIQLFLPVWSTKRPYTAILVSSPHPSFLVLHLHPTFYRSTSKSALNRRNAGVGGLKASPSTLALRTSGESLAGHHHQLPGLGQSHALAWPNQTAMAGSYENQWPKEGYGDADVSVGTGTYKGAGDITGSSRKSLEMIDWSQTPLGERRSWPGSLSTTVNAMLTMPDVAAVWYHTDSDWVILHNDAYQQDWTRHTGGHFGRLASEAWAGETWSYLQAKANEVMRAGKTWTQLDDLFFIKGKEAYFTWRWTPIQNEAGKCFGILLTSFNTTERVLTDRWITTQRDIAARLGIARTLQDFSDGILRSLEANERDVPYCLLYHLRTETGTGERADISSEATLQLSGTVGLPFDHESAPRSIQISLESNTLSVNGRGDGDQPISHKPFAPWPFRDAVQAAYSSDESVVQSVELEVPEEYRFRSWGDIPSSALVMKISNLSEPSGRLSFLIIGLNPRRPFDTNYRNWLEHLRHSLLASLQNITSFEAERKKSEQLQSVEKAKSLFFSSVSHELRTPLQLISGPLTDLEHGETDPKRITSFNMIQRNASRLIRLVDSLMDFSRIEGGRLMGRYSPVNLGEITSELADMFKPAIEKSRIQFFNRCDSGSAPGRVYVDIELWEKIVFNLLGNAYKYTLKGSIVVSVIYHPDEAEVSITDTGVGIPKADISKVTERFHRVASISRSHEGTGIGLALCAELIQLHGGRLNIESETVEESPTSESGSTFSVFLQYGKGHLPADQTDDRVDSAKPIARSSYVKGILDEAGRWNNRSNSSTTSTTMSDSGGSQTESSGRVDISTLFWDKSNVILIADDSMDMRQYLTSILAPYCKIICATDGQQALEMARLHSPNLIISDITMPKLDGYGLLAALRNTTDEDQVYIPVILVTARAGEEERVNGLLAGAEDYLSKPFSGRELIARAHLQMQIGKRRVELERNFREQLAATKLLSDVSPVGISRWDAEGKIVYVNDSWYQQSGHPHDKPLDSWLESVHPDFHDRLREIYHELFTNKTPGMDWEWMWSNGTWSFCQAMIVSEASSSLVGTICVLTDVTDRKRLEAERRSAVEVEEAHLRRRAEFAEEKKKEADEQKRHQEFLVSVVSHEVRNPVSAILQCAGLCSSNLTFIRTELSNALERKTLYAPTSELINLIDEDIDALESIHEMALSQERIANDVLSLGKIQLSTLEVFAIETNLAAEAKRILSVFEGECRTKGIRISLDLIPPLGVPDGAPIITMTDPVRLGQVIINLLSNAIRFTDKAASHRREIKIRIQVSARPPVDESCICPPTSGPILPGEPCWIYGAVEDSGPGLAPEELSMLFRRFSQASSATHTVFGGSGLGLYVCRMITGLMNGRIEVDSVRGEGSTFRFFVQSSIPAANQAPDPTVARSSISAKMRPLKVLIVEDNAVNARVLTRQLKKASHTTEVANDGQEGVDALLRSHEKGQKFDLVLMDVNMPIMDGLTATRLIRQMEADGRLNPPRTIVIGLTGNAQESQIADAKESGMSDIVVKPYKIDALLRKIQDLAPDS